MKGMGETEQLQHRYQRSGGSTRHRHQTTKTMQHHLTPEDQGNLQPVGWDWLLPSGGVYPLVKISDNFEPSTWLVSIFDILQMEWRIDPSKYGWLIDGDSKCW